MLLFLFYYYFFYYSKFVRPPFKVSSLCTSGQQLVEVIY